MSDVFGKTVFSDLKGKVEKEIIDPVNEAIESSVLDGHTFAIGISPWQTGRFRSAWRVTLNRPSTSSPIDPPSKLRKRKLRGTDFYSRYLAESKLSANRVMSRMDIRRHSVIYITNNTSYAKYIEYGGRNIPPHNIASKTSTYINTLLRIRLAKLI